MSIDSLVSASLIILSKLFSKETKNYTILCDSQYITHYRMIHTLLGVPTPERFSTPRGCWL